MADIQVTGGPVDRSEEITLDSTPVVGALVDFGLPSRRDADINRTAFAKVREDKEREGVDVTAAGLRGDVNVAVRYLESWLRGGGAVAINNLVEDAATAEISRSQIWRWVHNASTRDDGTTITAALVRKILAEEITRA